MVTSGPRVQSDNTPVILPNRAYLQLPNADDFRDERVMKPAGLGHHESDDYTTGGDDLIKTGTLPRGGVSFL